MSKWSGLKDKFPPKPFDDSGFIEKVDKARLQYVGMDMKGLTAHYAAQRRTKADLEDSLKTAEVNLAALSNLLIPEMEAAGVSSFRTESGELFYQSIEPYPAVIDRDVLVSYIDAHPEYKHLMGVTWMSLKTLVKDQLEQGQDDQILPGVSVYLDTQIRMRKS